MLLAFAPFVAFAVLNHFVSPTAALTTAALVSVLLTAHEIFAGRSAKILEVGTCILFVVLAAYSYLGGMDWSIIGVKLAVDIGLMAIVLLSFLIGRPFTLQYAQESAPVASWSSPEFLKTNRVITLVWLGAFGVLILADLILLYMPDVPHRVSVMLTIAALYGAFKFTQAYPKRAR
jgi:hypothetical protein